MLLISQRLSKLTVSAYLVCVLMVIICGTQVLCVRLYNQCSRQFIAVDRKGRVYALNKSLDYQNLTITSRDFTGKLAIFAEKSRRYLCFNIHWKLVGLRRHRGNRCLFYEEMWNSYTRYRSVADETRYIGINKKGLRMNSTKRTNLSGRMQKCLNFLKFDTDFDITLHNRIVGNQKNQSSDQPDDGPNALRNKRHKTSTAASVASPAASPNEEQSASVVRIRHKNHHQHQHYPQPQLDQQNFSDVT